MNLKTTVTASLLLLASTPLMASVGQCCLESRQLIGNISTFCESEEQLAAKIGQDFSERNRDAFGVSRVTQRLPIPSETSVGVSTRPISNSQNVGYILSPKANTSLKAVIPAFKYKSVSTGTECVSVEISKLDQAYIKFANLEKIDNQRTVGAEENSCLVFVNSFDSILASAHRESVRNKLKARNIHILKANESDLAKVIVSTSAQNLIFGANQYDLNYNVKGIFLSQDKNASYNLSFSIDYGRFGSRRVTYDKTLRFSRGTYNDQLDEAVLTEILSRIDVNACLSN